MKIVLDLQPLKKKILSEIPLRKTGKFSNIYKAIMYLINSEYTNNATINIDGAYIPNEFKLETRLVFLEILVIKFKFNNIFK